MSSALGHARNSSSSASTCGTFLNKFAECRRNRIHANKADLPISLRRSRTSVIGKTEKLWDRMVFNGLCCNTDAHAKNYSIHIFGDAFELTPIYDVMCAEAWPKITPYLAFDVDSQRKWRDIEGRHWTREAVACGFAGRLGPASAEAMARTILDNLDTAVEHVRQMPAGDHAMLEEFRDAVERCCLHTLSVIKRYDGKF